MRTLREILHQLLCSLHIRRNYAGKYLGQKEFSQRALRRKVIKEYEAYKKIDPYVLMSRRIGDEWRRYA